LYKAYLICFGLGYLLALVPIATALIAAAVIRAAGRNSFPKLLSVSLKIANGIASLGAMLAWGSLIGPYLRTGGDSYRYSLAAGTLIGLSVMFLVLRELDGLRKNA
jgi:hypothetical protein